MLVPIGISKRGQWLMDEDAQRLLGARVAKRAARVPEDDAEFAVSAAVLRSGEPLKIPATPKPLPKTIDLQASAGIATPESPFAQRLDVVFPVLHGTFGEDGTIQGLLELADMRVCRVGRAGLGRRHG